MSLGRAIWEDIQEIVNTNTDTFRVSMNSNVHCMDVGIQALKASDPTIDYSTKEKLHSLFRKEFFIFRSLEQAVLHARDTDNIDRSSFVEDPELGDYIVAPSYTALQRRVSRILKTSAVASSFTGTDVEGRTTTNIGHLSLKSSEAATTPLEVKLKRLLSLAINTPVASSLISSRIKQLHKFHTADTSYVFNRKTFNLQKLESILGSGTVLVVLQTSIKNKSLAKLEAKIERDVSSYLKSNKFQDKLLRLHGSNTIVQDIEGGLIATLKGSKTVPGSIHKPKPVNKDSKSLLSTKSVTVSKPGLVKSMATQRYSLASLQLLLNTHLQDVISANMGSGSSRDILNYRTGRFAASARVERMSQSREGMITAFYSYMKNPYQTFEPGYRQGSPKTRDPKLLIAKSIRDIAETKVANRMRAVVI